MRSENARARGHLSTTKICTHIVDADIEHAMKEFIWDDRAPCSCKESTLQSVIERGFVTLERLAKLILML